MMRPAIRIALSALLLGWGTSAYCQMYKWVDKNGKVQYTDQPPPQDAKQKGTVKPASPASAPPAEAKKGAATQDSFRPEEQTALKTMCAISLLESFTCRMDLKKFCSLEELVAGIGGNPNKGLKADPRLDPNYEYRLQSRGDEVMISAIPRRPGVTGFYNGGDKTRFKPNGPAGENDQKVEGGLNCAGLSK